jgi:two-component system probable response regulator PhcQ
MKAKDQIHILLVDDEPNVLKSLARLLRAYHITEALSGEDALQLLQEHSFDLIISDFRMPGIDGITFLCESLKIQPDAIRIILTGHADLNNVIAAINEANVYRFITKPWDGPEVTHAVESGLAHQMVLQENRQLANQVREQQKQLDEKNAILAALEKEEPGITHVDWAEDGSIIINEDDYN